MNPFIAIIKAFNKARIKYVIVGGVAVNLHGYPRFTGDLDLLVLLDTKNLKKIDSVMRKLRYSERLPVSILSLQDNRQVKNGFERKI